MRSERHDAAANLLPRDGARRQRGKVFHDATRLLGALLVAELAKGKVERVEIGGVAERDLPRPATSGRFSRTRGLAARLAPRSAAPPFRTRTPVA